MNNLWIIIKNEFVTDIKSKSFWISTFVFPAVVLVFGVVMGLLSSESDTLQSVVSLGQDPKDDLSGRQIAGMLVGMLLSLFIMIYGAMIFQKVKTEKCNRIIEILATCVDGKTMMLAKVVSVGLLGCTQLIIWGVCLFFIIFTGLLMAGVSMAGDWLLSRELWLGLLWGILYFAGGYIFFGSMFAAIGAMTDKNNENQEYVSLITFILLAGFYIGMFVVDHPESAAATWCGFIPFTSPTVGAINSIGGVWPWWETLLSLAALWVCAYISIALAGKIYTSSLLLKGKKLSPKDILTFLKSK